MSLLDSLAAVVFRRSCHFYLAQGVPFFILSLNSDG
jgi:hypothetical protein